MGVLLITASIVVSVAVGIFAEQRRPQAAVAAAQRALVLILYVLMPPVIFFNLAAAHIDLDHGAGLMLGLVTATLVALFVWWTATRILRLSRPMVGAVICAVLAVNSGYLGYPLTLALLGRDDLPDAVLYDVAVTAPSLLLGAFAVGAAFGTRAGETIRQRIGAFFTRNPLLFAAVLGLLAPAELAPEALVDASQALVIAILPIGFFAVGATLAEGAERGELPLPPPLTRPVLLVLVSRLAIVPVLLMLLAAPLIDLPPAYLLMAAMPSGLAGLIVSHAYGLDDQIVAEAIVWSTAIVILAALGSLLL